MKSYWTAELTAEHEAQHQLILVEASILMQNSIQRHCQSCGGLLVFMVH